VTERSRRLLLTAALVGVAAVWGSTFVMVQGAVADYPVFSFLAWRFAIATVAFAVIFPRTFGRMELRTVGTGVIAGLLLTGGYVFQTFGLAPGMTSPGRAAFITGMFVVITPFMQATLLRRMPRWTAWVGIGCAVTGLWLLSGVGLGGAWGLGDTLVLLCAVVYSGHIIVLGSLGRGHDTLPLTFVQLATVTVVCAALGVATEHAAIPARSGLWVALLVTGVFASAIAFAVQTHAQKHLSPTRTALILICEPAFGGLYAWIFMREGIGPLGVLGAVLILTGMAASDVLGAFVARRGEHEVLEIALEGPPSNLVEPD